MKEGKIETALRSLDVWRKWGSLGEMHFLVQVLDEKEKETIKQRCREQRKMSVSKPMKGWVSEKWEGCAFAPIA